MILTLLTRRAPPPPPRPPHLALEVLATLHHSAQPCTRRELYTTLDHSGRYPGLRRSHFQQAMQSLDAAGFLRYTALYEQGPPVGLKLSDAGHRQAQSQPLCAPVLTPSPGALLTSALLRQLLVAAEPLHLQQLLEPPTGRPRAQAEVLLALDSLMARDLMAEVGLGRSCEYSLTPRGRTQAQSLAPEAPVRRAAAA